MILINNMRSKNGFKKIKGFTSKFDTFALKIETDLSFSAGRVFANLEKSRSENVLNGDKLRTKIIRNFVVHVVLLHVLHHVVL